MTQLHDPNILDNQRVTSINSQHSNSIERMEELDGFTDKKLDELKIIHAGMHQPVLLNNFRELRTQLLQKQKNKNFTCMVTSVCPKGGNSYVATNLSTVFALDKAKTSILVDANMYSPSVSKLIIGDSEIGLTNFLAESHLEIKDIVYATGVKRLRAIPIGEYSEGAAEYFSSSKMESFCKELKSRYPDRYIFIDSPSIMHSPEARILSDHVDLIVLVVPYGKANIDQIQAAIDVVGEDKLCGLVYNSQ